MDLMNLPPHMKIQNINPHHRILGPSDSINPIHYAGSLPSCHSMNLNGMIISDPDSPSSSSKCLLPPSPSSGIMQQHLHHLPPPHYLNMQNMDPILAPPPNHQQQHMGLSPIMDDSFGMGPPPLVPCVTNYFGHGHDKLFLVFNDLFRKTMYIVVFLILNL